MNIKRIVEKDARTAIDKVKETYGEDAVILSNKRIGKEVEVIVAVELDDQAFDKLSVLSEKSQDAGPTRTAPSHSPLRKVEWMEVASKNHIARENVPAISEAESIQQLKNLLQKAQPDESAPSGNGNIQGNLEDSPENNQRLFDEISMLKDLFMNHLRIENSEKIESLSAEARRLVSMLHSIKLDESHIDEIRSSVLMRGRKSNFGKKINQWIEEKIPVAVKDISSSNGVYAFIGLSGSGKTSTIAKIASQHALKCGKESVAIITLDQNRIGSKEQVKLFGLMLGIDVYHASTITEVKSILAKINKEKILIDTAGFSLKNGSAYVQAAAIKDLGDDVNVVLTVASSMQASVNSKVGNLLAKSVDGVVITKADESLDSGAILSTLIKTKIPLIGVSNGQDIAGSFKAMSPRELVMLSLPTEEEANETSSSISVSPARKIAA
jgi:flagellar biosynthesis protein FlhF